MSLPPTLQERAYQLTRQLATIAAISQQLIREGYDNVHAQLSAPTLRRELKRLCRQSMRDRAAESSLEGATED